MGEDQFFGVALSHKTLIRTIEDLFVVIDHDNLRTVKLFDYLQSLWVIKHFFLDIKMRKKFKL